MENYSYAASYPESGESSPRSREIDFENPPPWEEQNHHQQPQSYKVKFMCSFGGKIHPRPHDNQLSYIGGETKILAVDRNIKFNSLVAKISALCDSESVSFKYQLPGEDLDALISVTNDDDLEHMLHEYDRLYRASPKLARLRLFLFPANGSLSASSSGVAPQRGFGSEDVRSEKERFVEALNSGPVQTTPAPPAPSPAMQPPNNVDFLFGLEKGAAPPQVPPLQPVKLRDPIADVTAGVHEQEVNVPGGDDRVIASDPIQKHIQDLQRLRLEEQQGLYRRKSDDSLSSGYFGEYYFQNVPEKLPPVTVTGSGPVQVGYWSEKQVPGGIYQTTSLGGTEQPVYMIPAPAGAYHAPMMRPMTVPVGQGYYTVQRMPPEVYRDQQVYNVMHSSPPPVQSVAAPPPTLPPQAQPRMSPAAYSEALGVMRPQTTGGIGMVEAQYSQVAYDSAAGRQVYYNAPGGGVMAGPPAPQQQQQQQPPLPQQYQTVPSSAAAVSDMIRPAGALAQDGAKVSV